MNDYLLNYQSDILLPGLVSATQYGSPTLALLTKNAKLSKVAEIRRAVQVLDGNQARSFNGAYTFPTVTQDLVKDLRFQFTNYGVPVTILDQDVIDNSASESQVLDYVKVQGQLAIASFKKLLNTDVFGDGTGAGGTAIKGLEYIIDDGTVSDDFGGLSRATYSGLKSYVATIVALTLDEMDFAFAAATIDSIAPTHVVMNKNTLAQEYRAIAQNDVRYNVMTMRGGVSTSAGNSVDLGFNSMFYRGCPIIEDNYCPADTVYFVNEDYIYFHYRNTETSAISNSSVVPNMSGTTIKGADETNISTLGITMTPFACAPGSNVYTGIIKGRFQAEGDPRFHSKIVVTS